MGNVASPVLREQCWPLIHFSTGPGARYLRAKLPYEPSYQLRSVGLSIGSVAENLLVMKTTPSLSS